MFNLGQGKQEPEKKEQKSEYPKISYDLMKKIVYVKFENWEATLPFNWIKEAYKNIVNMEEHCTTSD